MSATTTTIISTTWAVATYPGDHSRRARVRKEGIVGIRSKAHFGVKEQVLDAVVSAVRDALGKSFDGTQYGVSEIRVEREDEDSFVIKLKMVSGDAEQADSDADRAVESIKTILGGLFERGAVRERQRELTLA